MIEDDYTEDEYLQLLLVSYRDVFVDDPSLTADLIRADIETFALAENYEVCARLQKILKEFE